MIAKSVSYLLLVLFTFCPSIQFGYSLYFGGNVNVTTSIDPSSFMEGGLAATEKGDVYVVWVEGNAVYFRSSQDNGTKFGNPVLLSNVNQSLSPQTGPRIAATEKGDVYVVWVEGNAVYFRSSQDNGTKFGNPVLLSNVKRIAFSPQIAATEKGDVYVTWSDKARISGDSDIFLIISTDGGEDFGSSDRISRRDDLLSFSPHIAATETGNVYLVRTDMNNMTGESQIVFRSSADNGGEFRRNVYLNRYDDQFNISFSPQIAATEKGDVYAVWSENDIQFKEILVNGTSFTETTSINNRKTLGLSPQIAATEKGDVYLVWVDQTNSTDPKHLLFKRISHTFP